jgi:hypothetical protein
MHGSLDISGDRPALRFERHLEYPMERVWQAITDPRSCIPLGVFNWRLGYAVCGLTGRERSQAFAPGFASGFARQASAPQARTRLPLHRLRIWCSAVDR